MAEPIDQQSGYAEGLNAPRNNGFAITPGTTNFAAVTRAVYVGGAGDVVLTLADNTTLTFKAVPVGTLLPVRAIACATTSGATYMLGLY